MHAVRPRDEEKQTFFRPVSTFRCRFSLTETHVEIVVPVMPPAIVQDWLRDQRKYGGWDSKRLRSWLLVEDQQGDLQEEDDFSSPEFVEIPAFSARVAAAAGRDTRQPIEPGAIASRMPAQPETGYYIEALAKKVRGGAERFSGGADDRFDSPWEQKLYDALVARGLSPIPQHPVGGRFLDLALINDSRQPPKRIDVEVDGVTYHTDPDGNRLATDLWRDHQLRGLGWSVIRFWVYELRDNMEKCLERIEAQFRA